MVLLKFAGLTQRQTYNIVATVSLVGISLVYLFIPKTYVPSYYEMAISLGFFLISSYCLGYSLTKDLYNPNSLIEAFFQRIGFGLAIYPILMVLFETLHIPLTWYNFLWIGILRLVYDIYKGVDLSFRWDKDLTEAYALFIFFLAFTLALYGAYLYPYLEDGDPWEHAVGAKYVSIFSKYTQPEDVQFAHYLPPYPPAYDALLGVVHQLNTSVNWTLKTFNALLVALTYIFAFYFVRQVTRDEWTALFSSFILFCLPPFQSHTIWAHTYSITILFVVFYAVDRIREDSGWAVPATIFLASSLLIQPLMSLVMGFFYGLYILSRVFVNNIEVKNLFLVGVLALLLSCVYWVPWLIDPSLKTADLGYSELSSGSTRVGKTDDAPTALSIFFPKPSGDIFMQHGFGFFICLLTIGAVDQVFRNKTKNLLKSNPWILMSLLWLGFTGLMLFGANLPFSIWPTRWWGIVAIPVALLSGYMLSKAKNLKLVPAAYRKKFRYILLIGILITSFYPKVSVQAIRWPTDLEAVAGDSQAYLDLYKLKPNTPVYAYCTKDAYPIGMDKMGLPWDKAVFDRRSDPVNVDPKDLHTLLKSRGFEWVIFDVGCVKRCQSETGADKDQCKKSLENMLASLEKSKLFKMNQRSISTSIFMLL